MRPFRRLFPACLLATALSPLYAQLDITLPGTPYMVDFDLGGSSQCTANLPWTDNATIPHCYSDRPTYNYSNGCANIGGLHVAGLNGETALGGRSSNSTTTLRWGVHFRNGTGTTLGGLQVRFRAEQWGRAESNVQNVVQFAYRVSSSPITDVTSGIYTNVPALDFSNFTAPGGCSGSNSALNGNLPEYSAQVEGCLNVTLAPGDEIMLRWFDLNDPCNDHMLCVDDLEVTGHALPVLTTSGPTAFCAGGFVTLTVEDAATVLWNTGDTGPSITVDSAGTYTATATMLCGGPVVLTQNVEVLDGPLVAIVPDDGMLCPGATLELSVTGDADALLWSTGEISATIVVDAPGTYSVSASNACGTAEASVTVGPGAIPVAAITADSGTSLCTGSSVELTASGGDTFLWNTGSTGTTETVNGAGTWTVTVTNTCESDQASITTEVIALPTVQIDAPTLVLCGDGGIVLTATGDGPFTWSNGQSGPSISVHTPGTYTATSSNACASASASIVIGNGQVEAVFTAIPQEGPAPLTVFFTDGSSSGVTHAWDLGNGETAEGTAPATTYTAPGTYIVALTVTDLVTGCSATAYLEIIVLPGDSWVRVPNVFSPNGDGVNDGFSVEHEGLVELDCAILNRWGQEVGRLAHPDAVWRGRDMPDGTYYYVLTAKGADGRTYALQGHVRLLR